VSIKEQLKKYTKAHHRLEWLARVEVIQEEAAKDAYGAAEEIRTRQLEVITHLLKAESSSKLITELKQIREQRANDDDCADETGMETLWELVTHGAAGLHHDLDFSNRRKLDAYVRVLNGILRMATKGSEY
jgi:hypothetical protein